MSRSHDVTIAVLAGGEGSRMGRPKAELVVAGRPILAWLRDRFDWAGPAVIVTAPGRQQPAGAERFDAELVDPVAGQGPLRGVLTALEHATLGERPGPIVIVTTIDMPLIGAAQFDWLIEQLIARPNAHGLLLSRGQQIEPFPSIYRASAERIVRSQIEAKRLSIRALLDQRGFERVAAPTEWDDRVWTNLNTPGDVERFLKEEI